MLPLVADPRVRRIVADQPLPVLPRSGHDAEVVQVVAGCGDGRAVPAVRNQDDVAGVYFGQDVDRALRGAVHPVKGEPVTARATADLEVVDLFQVRLHARYVLVVLVRWVGRP